MNLSPAFCILFYRNKQKYWRDGTPTKPGEVVLHRQLVRPPEHPGGGGRLPDVVISQDAAPGNLHVLVELPAVEIIPSSNTLTALFSHTFPLSLSPSPRGRRYLSRGTWGRGRRDEWSPESRGHCPRNPVFPQHSKPGGAFFIDKLGLRLLFRKTTEHHNICYIHIYYICM